MESAKYVHFLSSHNIHFLSVDVSCFSFPVLLPHNGANFGSGQRKYKQSMDLEYEQGLQAYRIYSHGEELCYVNRLPIKPG